MPIWGEILKETTAAKSAGKLGFDVVRRKYLRLLHEYTGRATILYAANFQSSQPMSPVATQLNLQDVDSFMNAVAHLEGDSLDLILHSSGGRAEAAESVVSYLRGVFDHIRVIVPVAAQSAATMVALGADELVLGRHSQLGPIDPQLTISTPEGPRSAPAQAIIRQFDRAKMECAADPKALIAWAPILRAYGPGLLEMCEDASELAETMVADWLKKYMFKGRPDAEQQADKVAKWFANYEEFKSHGRRVGLDQLTDLGLVITELESDDELQDLVLSVHHATMITFGQPAPLAKITENHLGEAMVRFDRLAVELTPMIVPAQPTTPSPPGIPGPADPQPAAIAQPPTSRQQRRQQQRKGRRRK